MVGPDFFINMMSLNATVHYKLMLPVVHVYISNHTCTPICVNAHSNHVLPLKNMMVRKLPTLITVNVASFFLGRYFVGSSSLSSICKTRARAGAFDATTYHDHKVVKAHCMGNTAPRVLYIPYSTRNIALIHT